MWFFKPFCDGCDNWTVYPNPNLHCTFPLNEKVKYEWIRSIRTKYEKTDITNLKYVYVNNSNVYRTRFFIMTTFIVLSISIYLLCMFLHFWLSWLKRLVLVSEYSVSNKHCWSVRSSRTEPEDEMLVRCKSP